MTDQINRAETPLPPDGFVFEIDSVGTLHGVIYATDDTYTVAGVFKEHREWPLAPGYFKDDGRATISGPGGVVVRDATFSDFYSYPPVYLALEFTSTIACHLG